MVLMSLSTAICCPAGRLVGIRLMKCNYSRLALEESKLGSPSNHLCRPSPWPALRILQSLQAHTTQPMLNAVRRLGRRACCAMPANICGDPALRPVCSLKGDTEKSPHLLLPTSISAGMSRSTSKCLQVPSPAASVPCTACLIMTI